MLLGKLAQYGTRLALALILGLVLVGSSPIPVQATEPIDLELGGEGATSWNIENIKPGDSGTKTVELHNAGSRDGAVTIWISDIEEVDHGGDGAVLDDYLLFNLSCEQLSSNIAFPVTIHQLPQSASDANQVKIDRLHTGETVTLVWEWEFLETGETQNDAQGDSLSFTINYMLEELPYGGGGIVYWVPSYKKLEIDVLGKVTVTAVSSSGRLLGSCIATDPDNKHKLEFRRGTKIACTNGEVPRRIEMRFSEESPLPPSGMEMIGPAYSINGYISRSVPCSLTFDKPVELTLSYEPDWLPEGTSSLVLTFYEPKDGWKELEPVYSGVAQLNNKVTALVRHTSIFAILAEIVLPPIPAPAKFELSEFAINPAQTEVGEPVTISAVIQNTGELKGGYILTLKINGVIEQSKEFTLAAGESRQVSFTVIRDDAGTYVVDLGGLTGEFIVLAPAPPPASSPPESHVYWWFILVATGVIAPVVYFLATRRRNHS